MSDKLVTLVDIANRNGVTHRQASYAFERAKIEPTACIKKIFFFDETTAAQVEDAMRRTGAIPSTKRPAVVA